MGLCWVVFGIGIFVCVWFLYGIEFVFVFKFKVYVWGFDLKSDMKDELSLGLMFDIWFWFLFEISNRFGCWF